MNSHSHALFLSPALPSDLLDYIIHHCTYPTTLIICSDRAEFLSSLIEDIKQQQEQEHEQQQPQHEPHDPTVQQATADPAGPGSLRDPQAADPLQTHDPPKPNKAARLLRSPLYQVAVARHIRTVFTPTVTHLRAFLSVFSVHDDHHDPSSKVSPPPPGAGTTSATTSKVAQAHSKIAPPAPPPPPPPLLLVYGFLALHRDTSEWSVQGVSNSAAVLVEAASRAGLRAVVVERRRWEVGGRDFQSDSQQVGGREMRELLAERVPVLSGSARRTGLDAQLEGSGWTGRTVDVGRVLGRWFRFRLGEWAAEGLESAAK
ncbi:hypothetical protein VTK56DRAFT_9100 [Thermocarpiscus australiensis]